MVIAIKDLLWFVPLAAAGLAIAVAIIDPTLIWTVPQRVRTLLKMSDSPPESGAFAEVAQGKTLAELSGDDRTTVLITVWVIRSVAMLVLLAAIAFVVVALIA